MRPHLPFLLATVFLLPILVAFSPPMEEGTHVTGAAGGGRFLSYSGCANPRLVEFTDQQVGVHHRWKPQGRLETRYGMGLEADLLQGRQKECTETDCRNTRPGWVEQPMAAAVSPYVSADWRYFGVSAGARLPIYQLYIDSEYEVETTDILAIPIRGRVRAGRDDLFYVSLDILNGRPVSSGSTFPLGVGGRFLGTDLWLAPPLEFDDFAISGAISRPFGPVRLTLAGLGYEEDVHVSDRGSNSGEPDEGFRVALPGYSWSVGLDYHLPW